MLAAALSASALLFSLGGCGTEAEFNGTALKNADAAPEISLTNQLGQPASLRGLRGSVVALTFLYTHCPDVCPIVTSQLRDVHRQLGDDAGSVEFVAVSVDPERDTVEAAREYLERWELAGEWQYLVGGREELAPVWESYYVDPFAAEADAAPTPEPRGAIDALSAKIGERYTVIHSAPVFLIDRDGRRRVVFTTPLEPAEVVDDIRALLE